MARALAADPPVLLMDEPFSAVDPVVRAGLQEELLRLQGELNKTVLFVTHDIEEAVRLGDQVVVLREHGHIAQLADPHTLLTAPADEGVAAFLGRDRGLRGLGLRSAATVTVQSLTDTSQYGGWELLRDTEGRPTGWRSGDDQADAPAFHPATDTLRTALDAAVLSPVGLAVAVDADGRAVGTADRVAVLAALADDRSVSARGR